MVGAAQTVEDLQNFLEADEKRPGETVLGVISYGPSSTLIVTNLRIIGKTQEKNPHSFRGGLDYEEITQVSYRPGIPFLGEPSLRIQYRAPDGSLQEIRLRFPGRFFGTLLFKLAGFGPGDIYTLIREQVSRRAERNG